MARLIDADALIVEWNKLAKGMARDGDGKIPVDFGLVICELSKTPTVDAVPAVRCRDCKFGDPEDEWINCTNLYGEPLMPFDGFCSYGERKDGDGNGR